MPSSIFRHFWILIAVVMLVNVVILRVRSRKYILEKPERAAGYNRIFIWMVILGAIIWLPLGLGIELGAIQSPVLFSSNGEINPFMLASMLGLAVMDLLGFYWIFFKGGAEFLADHPGLFRGENLSPRAFKLYYLLGVASQCAAVVMMYSMRHRMH